MAEIAAEGEPTTSAGHPETQSPEPGAKGGVVPRTPRASARNVAPTSAYRDVLRRVMLECETWPLYSRSCP